MTGRRERDLEWTSEEISNFWALVIIITVCIFSGMSFARGQVDSKTDRAESLLSRQRRYMDLIKGY